MTENDMPGLVRTEWGVQDKMGVHAVSSKAAARTTVENMREYYDPGAAVVWRGVTAWQQEDPDD